MIVITFDIIFLEKINVFLETIISWGGRNLNVHEELSCSYQPSRKKREDVVHNELLSTFASKITECDSSNDITATPRQCQNNYFVDDNPVEFDDSESSFERLRHNMDLPRTRR